MLPAQLRLSRGRQGSADRRRRLERRLVPPRSRRAAARVYAGWGFSQAFYRQQLEIKTLGYSSLEDFLVAFWEGFFLPKDANNLLTMLWTWQNGDISDNEIYKGDFKGHSARSRPKPMSCRARPIFTSRSRTASSR
jgi:hypothetical protein